MRSGAAVAVLVGFAIAAEPAAAWTAETRLRVADEAVRFMPASLRIALERHREEMRRGVLEPMVDEESPEHLPPSAGGTLDASIAGAAEALREGVSKPLSFREVARRFGVLAHFVSDAGFPPLAAARTTGPRYRHFAEFANRRLVKFPLVFLGHDDGDLARGDFGAFARRTIAQSAREDDPLSRAYDAAGWPPDPAAFDDRSVPFAVASLSYSRTVNAVVRVWLETWRRSGGDLGYTPYLKFDAPAPK